MQRHVPLDVFDRVEHPIFVTDEEGRVEYCNRFAAALFGWDAATVRGRPCWEAARLRSADGKILCQRSCAVQSRALESSLEERLTVARLLPGKRNERLHLFTFPVSPPREGRLAVLHLLKPVAGAHVLPAPGSRPGDRPEAFARLTAREREVLDRLSSGMTTEQISEALFVSPATVRNHVRNILSKLGVHHRIEAILSWILCGQ